jgi:hypothetical protein
MEMLRVIFQQSTLEQEILNFLSAWNSGIKK